MAVKNLPTAPHAQTRTVRGSIIEVDSRGNVTHVKSGEKIGRVVPVVADGGKYDRDKYQTRVIVAGVERPVAWKVTSFASKRRVQRGHGDGTTYLSQRTAIMAMIVDHFGDFALAAKARKPRATAPRADVAVEDAA